MSVTSHLLGAHALMLAGDAAQADVGSGTAHRQHCS